LTTIVSIKRYQKYMAVTSAGRKPVVSKKARTILADQVYRQSKKGICKRKIGLAKSGNQS
jgi:hypothetical protein